MASSEEKYFAQIRKVLSYLPLNNLEDAPFRETSDSVERADPELRGVVPTTTWRAAEATTRTSGLLATVTTRCTITMARTC